MSHSAIAARNHFAGFQLNVIRQMVTDTTTPTKYKAIAQALFKVLKTQNIIDGEADITLVPQHSGLMGGMVAVTQAPKGTVVK